MKLCLLKVVCVLSGDFFQFIQEPFNHTSILLQVVLTQISFIFSENSNSIYTYGCMYVHKQLQRRKILKVTLINFVKFHLLLLPFISDRIFISRLLKFLAATPDVSKLIQIPKRKHSSTTDSQLKGGDINVAASVYFKLKTTTATKIYETLDFRCQK